MRPVTLNLGGIKDPQVAAALQEIQRASQDTLQNDQSSSGGAMATLIGAAADQIAYFTSQYTTAYTALTAFGRTLIGSADAPTARASIGVSPPQCGVFVANSATQVAFNPKNGDRVQIAGTVYAIPTGGVVSNNTSAFVNGTGSSNLAANTPYLVCVFNNSGTLALDFISTIAHLTDLSAGNVGVEVEASNNTRTVVGMVLTNGSAQFVDSLVTRYVLSWFNRQNKPAFISVGNVSTASTSPVALNGTALQMLNWADESIFIGLRGQTQTTGSACSTFIAADGVSGSQNIAQMFTYNDTINAPMYSADWQQLTEGYHYFQAWGYALSAGTTNLSNSSILGMTRG